MSKYPALELPIRSKLGMLSDIVQIIHDLHMGNRKRADLLLDDLKVRSTFMDEKIQGAVLIFAEQVHFQYAYDPWHKVTAEVQKAADQLIENLGFSLAFFTTK